MRDPLLGFLQLGSWSESDHGSRKTWKILIILLAIAFGLRLFLVIFPEVIYSDGTEYVRCAKQILSGNWKGSKAPPFYPVLIALASQLTPNFELAGIWVSVIFGTLVILPVFYLGKEMFNEKVGILSAVWARFPRQRVVDRGSVGPKTAHNL